MRKLKVPVVIDSTAPWGSGRFVFTHFDPRNQRYYDPSSGGTLSPETLERIRKGQIKWHKLVSPASKGTSPTQNAESVR